ncbi:MAG: DNA translocase FtsK [Parachlamydiales bacterium]|jgi:S-DNA-T family DNA segregation ATPase FtsK/SpoIIIE
MKKKPKSQFQLKLPSEAKGFFFLVLAALLFLALASYGHEETNFLGAVGYSIGWLFFALFGLAAYLFLPFLVYLGAQTLKTEKEKKNKAKNTSSRLTAILYFAVFLISISFLLNVFSEYHPTSALRFQNQIFSENLYLTNPPNVQIRFYLGGFPTYYLYKDLLLVNLEQLFSASGTVFLFSLIALASLLLLIGMPNLKKGFLLGKNSWDLLKKLSIKKPLFPGLEKPKAPFKAAAKINTNEAKKTKSPLAEDLFEELFLKKPPLPPTLKTEKSPKDPPPAEKLPEKSATEKAEKALEKMPESLPEALINNAPPKPVLKTPPPPKNRQEYRLPPVHMLSDPPKNDLPSIKKELSRQAEILEETLKSFGIEGKVKEINCGPTITSFEVQPAIGVKVQKIKALENDIALNLQAKSIRIIAPIPGKAAVGVEIPSLYPQAVTLKELLVHYQSQKKKSTLPLLLGKTVSGEYVTADLAKMPHLLIAGATGSGKSVCINTIVMSLLMSLPPDELKLMMVDPKKVELTQYSELPHMIAPVITESYGAYAALQWLVREMQSRYEIFKQLGHRNIASFNSRRPDIEKEKSLLIPVPDKLPFVVAIIDEFADLMMVSSSDLETPIARIAQMARAVGIHLILATQRPSREVITGIIKANFPSRIAFKVASRVNSQIILDENGAESLLGNGDLLFSPPGSSHLIRAQGAYISDEDINEITASISKSSPPNYLISSFDNYAKPETASAEEGQDTLYDQALAIVLQYKNASTTFLQRKLKIGYARAASLIDALEENGVIGKQEGSKPRRILIEESSFLPEDPL